jgi:branched-chain amino acid aminotransferase
MPNQKTVWLNGKMIPWEDAKVPILSHGLSRGSAIFEVFGVHPGSDGPKAFRMDKHLDRLFHTADCLGMELAYTREEFAEAASKTARANKIGRGLIKIVAYWSDEPIISLVLDCKLDTAVFAVPEGDGLVFDTMEPATACFSKWYKLHPLTVPTSAKACAYYLNGMLARKNAMERGYDIGILRHTDGFVAEGSIESVFMVKDGVLRTPPLGNILSSITRMSIIEIAKYSGIEVSQALISASELENADEIFTSHTGTKVLPIKKFENKSLPAPGPYTEKIMKSIQNITSFKDERFEHWFQPL